MTGWKPSRGAALALGVVWAAAGAATGVEAGATGPGPGWFERAGDRVETSGRYTGVYAPRPGCCANAPWPPEVRSIRRHVYPDGRVVIVYPYKNGTGYQPFAWEQR